MSNKSWILLLGSVLFLTAGCLADSSDYDESEPPDVDDGGSDDGGLSGEPPFATASGFAQKGPFRAGGSVIIAELDEDGEESGETLETDLGEWGEFSFNDIPWTGPSIIRVSGDWFHELEGNFSGEAVELKAMVNIADSDDAAPFLGNVNLLSHLQASGILSQWRSDSVDDYETALERVNATLQQELGQIADPRQLNLFEHGDDPLVQHGSGLMTAYSIAAAELDVSDLVDTFNNAWDGNALKQDALEQWEAIENQALTLIEEGDFEAALQQLVDNYNGVALADTLDVGGRNAMTLVNACQPTTTTEPVPRLCMNHPQSMDLREGESQMYWFRAPYDGAFRFRARGELSVHDTIVRLWGSIDEDGEGISNPREVKTIHDTNMVSSHILEEGDRVYIEVEAYADDGDPMEVTLSAHRQNEGSERRPAWIFPLHAGNPYANNNDMQHFVGSQHRSEGENANNQSYYRFISWGFSTLRYYEHACGWVDLNGTTTVSLYRSNTVSGAFSCIHDPMPLAVPLSAMRAVPFTSRALTDKRN